MRVPFFLLFFCLLPGALAFSQSRKIEILKRELAETADHSRKTVIYVSLANTLYDYNLEQGLSYALLGRHEAGMAKDSIASSLSLNAIGNYYFHKGDNAVTEKYFRDAIYALTKIPPQNKSHEPFLNLSLLFREQGQYDSANLWMKRAEKVAGPASHPAILAEHASFENYFARNEHAVQLLKDAIKGFQTNDTSQLIKAMVQLSSVYTALAQYDSADLYYKKSEALLEVFPNHHAQILLHIHRGETNFVKGDFNNAIDDYNKALDKLKDNIYRRPYALLLYLIGELYGNQGVSQTAFEYLFNSLREFEALNAKREMARATSQIGWAYNFQENYSEALVFGNRSLDIATALHDSASIGQNKNLLGYALLKLGRLKEALANFESALTIRRRIKNYWGVTYTLYNTSLVYIEMGHRKKAMALLKESLDADKKIGNKSGYVFTSNELGRLYAEDGQFALARTMLAEANQLARKIPLPSQLLTNYKNFIFLSEREKANESTISYYKLYTALSDSLNRTTNTGRISKADALFQLQKKTQEIQLINAESALKQERIHAQQAEIDFQRTVIVGSIAGILLLLVLFFFIYKLLRSNIKAKEILSLQNRNIHEQKEEIQTQAEELTESNMRLLELNTQLEEKNSEIELQSERIKETNNTLELRVDERTRQLQHAYQELETFFYRTSHDFRRPLTTYLGLVEIANASIKDEQALYIFNKVKENTLALDGMLNKLQSISNVDINDIHEAVDIPALIARVIERHRSKIEKKGIAVTVKSEMETACSNPELLYIILDNIVENAVIFNTPIEPTIKITASLKNNNLIFTIEDNGQGIHPDVHQKIFEMYFRGTITSAGNGLGLYIAKRAVEKLDGTISFTSIYNEGSSFQVVIPMASRIP